MDKMLIAAFTDRTQADMAVNELADAGYETKEISVISKENKPNAEESLENSAEGAAAGATTGGAIGGLAGLLAGAGVFPALAGLFIGGPIALALGLTGVAASTVSGAVTGAAVGSLVGVLTALGLPEDTAHNYASIVDKGGVILGVPIKEEEGPQDLLAAHGAQEISEINVRPKEDEES